MAIPIGAAAGPKSERETATPMSPAAIPTIAAWRARPLGLGLRVRAALLTSEGRGCRR